MPPNADKWQFWIDRGGTFTDIVARTPEGQLLAKKLLSEAPHLYQDAALAGIREFLRLPSDAQVPEDLVSEIKMGTTVATNALLERKGERVVLVITAGLEDQLEIGTQARPDIFARKIRKPEVLHQRVIGAHERVFADGTVERPLDTAALERELEKARSDGFESVAIVLMHAYAFPDHEKAATILAKKLGFSQVSVSSEVSPLIKIVGRGDTTVADAYLSPVLRRYVDQVAASVPGAHKNMSHLRFMASSGGLKSATVFRGRDAILSGPAGGVVGMAETGRKAGFDRIIGFDMGGTSTDVSHFAGEYERSFETEVAGTRLRVPMLNVHTVAAGGGSILAFDGSRFRVGPESAGSNPGPMCYRRGGPLTVTDANVMLGKLNPDHFPCVFGESGSEPIDTNSVRLAFASIADKLGDGRTPEAVADGFVHIAVESMANAIRRISVERGYDVTRYALNCFGAAAGQHACLIADSLGMDYILVHPLSGLLSAYGIGLAKLRTSREQSVELELSETNLPNVETRAAVLQTEAIAEMRSQGGSDEETEVTSLLHLRYNGTDTALPVRMTSIARMRSDFEAAHQRRFGFLSPEKKIFIAAIEVEAQSSALSSDNSRCTREDVGDKAPIMASADKREGGTTQFYSDGKWHHAPIILRNSMGPGTSLQGPAIIIEPHQTVCVEPGWSMSVSPDNDLIMKRSIPRAKAAPTEGPTAQPDPVLLEVMNNLFIAIAEQMGEALRNTAQSVNIKERLDFSCAIFDPEGNLVANAPHVPVHLGSMDASIKSVVATRGADLQPGDVYMINAPYAGGTHLPDITVVTPVFDQDQKEIIFFVASRGHHADIGGVTPGSMSPNARTIDEEGVLINCVKLVEAGRFLEDDVRTTLTSARFPARSPDQNIADLKAQVAANARGRSDLLALVADMGLEVVHAYMQHVQDNAEEAVRRLVSKLSNGHARIETDQGWAIEVHIDVDKTKRTARIDFAGTSPQQNTNFNAPEPVTRAAVLYAFRVLVDEPIPMNAGCLRPLEISIPDGSLLKPRYPAAVVAGNTETSQIVTNALFAALGALAPSQGTMNNLTFGNSNVQYYETICSGAPAGYDRNGSGFDGSAAVQVHMTNTRLTDPEILELRYPVVLEEFSIRRGSGGQGQWSAGDGVRRVIRMREPMTCAILSGYRNRAPVGLNGGCDGQVGRNTVRRTNGTSEQLHGCAEVAMNAGDAIEIETPTGGGLEPPPDLHPNSKK